MPDQRGDLTYEWTLAPGQPYVRSTNRYASWSAAGHAAGAFLEVCAREGVFASVRLIHIPESRADG